MLTLCIRRHSNRGLHSSIYPYKAGAVTGDEMRSPLVSAQTGREPGAPGTGQIQPVRGTSAVSSERISKYSAISTGSKEKGRSCGAIASNPPRPLPVCGECLWMHIYFPLFFPTSMRMHSTSAPNCCSKQAGSCPVQKPQCGGVCMWCGMQAIIRLFRWLACPGLSRMVILHHWRGGPPEEEVALIKLRVPHSTFFWLGGAFQYRNEKPRPSQKRARTGHPGGR